MWLYDLALPQQLFSMFLHHLFISYDPTRGKSPKEFFVYLPSISLCPNTSIFCRSLATIFEKISERYH